tara:strand:+ start:203 stop:316 length:114 start_codon:yes stop_codon:yes gene_type:complete
MGDDKEMPKGVGGKSSKDEMAKNAMPGFDEDEDEDED